MSLNYDRFTNAFFYLVIFGCIVGALITFFFIGLPEEENYYSVLFFVPGSYSNFSDNNIVSFTYAIKNLEATDTEYNVKFYAANTLLGSENLTVARNTVEQSSKNFSLQNLMLSFPVKIRVETEANGKNYEIFYWYMGKEA